MSLAVACTSSSSLPPIPDLKDGWNAVDGMVCGDGSPTGVFVSFGTTNRVLVLLDGIGGYYSGADKGGYCLERQGCSAFIGPFPTPGGGDPPIRLYAGSVADRSLPGNPFASWTIARVHYCTADLYLGAGAGAGGLQSSGEPNLRLAIRALAHALPTPEKFVIAGYGAGGVGAFLGLDLAARAWPHAQAYLVADEAPVFVRDDLPASIRDPWWPAWDLDGSVTPVCPGCRTDLSQLFDALHAAHPSARLGILQVREGWSLFGYYDPTFGSAAYWSGFQQLQAKLAGVPNSAWFVASDPLSPGTPEAPNGFGGVNMLEFGDYTARLQVAGTSVLSWLALEVSDDPAWKSMGP